MPRFYYFIKKNYIFTICLEYIIQNVLYQNVYFVCSYGLRIPVANHRSFHTSCRVQRKLLYINKLSAKYNNDSNKLVDFYFYKT